MTSAVNADLALKMPEHQLQSAVEQLAQLYRWRHYHTYRSTKSPSGFPDLVLVSAEQQRVVYAELKSTKGRLSKAQRDWLADLEAAGQEVYLWKPADWVSGKIHRTLKP